MRLTHLTLSTHQPYELYELIPLYELHYINQPHSGHPSKVVFRVVGEA